MAKRANSAPKAQTQAAAQTAAPKDDNETFDALAALKFEAVDGLPSMSGPEFMKRAEDHIPAVVFAFLTLQMNETELAETIRDVIADDEPEAEPLFDLMRTFADAADWFEAMADALRTARVRTACGLARNHVAATGAEGSAQ